MFGERLRECRKRAGLSQHRLAVELGDRYDHSVISRVENGHSNLLVAGVVRAAHVLGVSVDYLVGLTDNPIPMGALIDEYEAREEEIEAGWESIRIETERYQGEVERLRAQVVAKPESPDPDVLPIQSAPASRDEDYETVRRYESEDVRLAAGVGAFADQEPFAGEVKFRTSWLRTHHLRAKDVFLVDVLGDSMERTIFDGDAALVNETHTSPRSGKIYALRTGDGLLVKRLRKRDHRWWADGDNEEYEPQPLNDRARIMGRVVWWAHTD